MNNTALEKHHIHFPAATNCYHCGEDCPDNELVFDNKYFCCNGCLSVYQLLNKAGLCSYYELNPQSGINRRIETRKQKFAFLDSPEIANQLILFKNNGQAHVTFYIPVIHCSSCIYLLENLHRIAKGVVRCDIQFLKKEVTIVFNENEISLRGVAEKLTEIGYEPYISHNHSVKKKTDRVDRNLIYRLGVAGFCFGNIMLFSIPEYFSEKATSEPFLGSVFRYLNVAFSLPVFFYSAAPFFIASWKGIKQKYLNIDVPVALAILATFVRSLTDVVIDNGSGFFDAMSGIVFFMLAGRVLQDRTQRYLFFDRDYADYFPMAALRIQPDGTEKPTILSKIREGDHLKIYNSELIPADSMLIRGKCLIDYSFVTGESEPVEKKPGDLLYAGGRQLAGAIEVQVVRENPASRLIELWSKELDESHQNKLDNKSSFVHVLARNFTLLILLIALITAVFWWRHNPALIWPAVTSILIIACPCGLLLTSTFTNGFVMRILASNGLFLRNPGIIERIGKITHVVFDKTGTLTSSDSMTVTYKGDILTNEEREHIASAARSSLHPFKNPVLRFLKTDGKYQAKDFTEFPGIGITATVNDMDYKIGTGAFFDIQNIKSSSGTPIYIYRNGKHIGTFYLQQGLRKGVSSMFERLQRNIKSTLLSGDDPMHSTAFKHIFNKNMFFKLSPVEKLSHIENLQFMGDNVAMLGDGLNDAGALKKSDVGICITDDINRFTPAGDAILQGDKLSILDKIIMFCKQSKQTIQICFGISVIYNITGIYFAVQGVLSPLIAAILMPLSTLTIVITTFASSRYKAQSLKEEVIN